MLYFIGRAASVEQGHGGLSGETVRVGLLQDMQVDTQDPFALNNLLRVNLQSREDVLVRLGRQPDVYEQLTASLAPSIWEMDDVKKGILCQLFGAATKVRPACSAQQRA